MNDDAKLRLPPSEVVYAMVMKRSREIQGLAPAPISTPASLRAERSRHALEGIIAALAVPPVAMLDGQNGADLRRARGLILDVMTRLGKATS